MDQVDKISASLPALETVSWHLRDAVEFYHGIGKRRLVKQSLAGARDGHSAGCRPSTVVIVTF